VTRFVAVIRSSSHFADEDDGWQGLARGGAIRDMHYAGGTVSANKVEPARRQSGSFADAPSPSLPASEPLDRRCKRVADTALGMDVTGFSGNGFKLPTQPQNLHIDAAVEDVLMHTRRLEQIFPAQWALGGFKKGDQQGILSLRQRHR